MLNYLMLLVVVSLTVSGCNPKIEDHRTQRENGFALTLGVRGNNPIVIAHRGNSSRAPENTIPAITTAAKSFCNVVEIDLQTTKDGKAIILHDPDLNRTTNIEDFRGYGNQARDLNFAQIRELDAGSWFDRTFSGTKIPTLEEALRAAKENNLRTIIDNKSGTVAQILEIPTSYDLSKDLTIQSPDLNFLAEINRARPEASLTLLGDDEITPAVLARAKEIGIRTLNWKKTQLTPETIQLAKKAGFTIYVYTINEAEEIIQFTEWGVDGILTDKPEMAHAAIQRANSALALN